MYPPSNWSPHHSLSIPNCRHNLSNIRLDNTPSLYHFREHLMKRFKVKDQIEFANVFEQSVQRFYKYLNQIKKTEFGFKVVGDDDEVEGCIVAVDDSSGVIG